MSSPSKKEAVDRATVGVAIPAAGIGARMGGVRKPLLTLAGRPVLLRALQPFLDHPQVESVVVALGEADILDPPPFLQELGSRIGLVQGGATRGESVWSAVRALPASVDLIAVHDAARPLVTREIIDRCIGAAAEGRGAVAGWPATDTLKETGEGGRIGATLPRDRVWHAQTPQIFPRAMIVEAYEAAAREGVSNTDDAALVERTGGEVVMVEGSPSNLKITRPEDLALAEFFLREEGE